MKTFSTLLASLILSTAGICGALGKEVSLVTKQPIGELVVAGRLSIELHAEFMMTRTYETEAVINWYNLGYSGGGKDGKVTQVGGDFGDFGLHVPYAERDKRYPHAVKIGAVPAAHFDGNDVMKGNCEIEKNLAGAKPLAIEIWFRAEKPQSGNAIMGWQSRDGKATSAAISLPTTFKGSDELRHLVVNAAADKEDWYLDGMKVSGGPRKTIIEEGHILVLGGASADKPSFKGDLVAVRLHDEAMTEEEIAHNFRGGAMLGTEMHVWWRTEPDKWWVKESEHFRHCVDKQEMAKWSAKDLSEFNDRVPRMFNMAELIYRTYTERLALRSSVVSVLPAERGDGIKYKIPIQPSQGSWMGWDGHFGFACQGAGHINPHELAHGLSAMTGNMAGNFWEAFANWPQTYDGIYQTIPIIVSECSAFPASGRTYYHDRLFFEHLAQSPEYGPAFIAKMWYDGPTESEKSPYPFITFTRLNPYPDRPLAYVYTRMAMRNVTYDYETYAEAPGGLGGNTPWGNDHVLSKENIYQRAARNSLPDINRYSRAVLRRIPYDPEWWRVPKEQAPQQLGWNICPLTVKPGTVTATLRGYVNPQRGSNWSAGFVSVDAEGKAAYGEVFGPGKEQRFEVAPDAKELFLVVCSVPTDIMPIDMVGDFRSLEQEQFPYAVKLTGCQPLDVLVPATPTVAGAAHASGGGFVERTAQVEATAYVGPNAQVLGNSKVLGGARIEDYAVVHNATIKDDAVVCGHALVKEDSVVAGNARIRDYAVVKHRTTVKGNARILQHGAVLTQKTCGDNVTVKGAASVYGGNQSGSAMLDGFYAKGNEITKGRWFTWSWGAGKNPGEVDENYGGVYADYTFDRRHPWMAWDAFGVTWGYLVNGPEFEPVSGTAKPASSLPDCDPDAKHTNHALVLNGKDQFVELTPDVADMRDCTYSVEFWWDGGDDGARLFEFANENGDAMWLSPSEGGRMVFGIRKATASCRVAAPAATKGAWTTVQVIIEGTLATLRVDGKPVAENPKMRLLPEAVRATQCYLGRGLKGGYFAGKIDRFAIHSVPLFDHTPPAPDPAAFEPAPQVVSPTAVALSAARGTDPLGVVEYYFEQEGGGWSSGWIKDTFVRVETGNVASPPHYRVKMRDKLGNETKFSESVRPAPLKSASMVTVTPDAPAVIEAEHCIASVPSLDGTFKWEQHGDPLAVGEGHMSTPDRGQVNEPFAPTAAHMDYAVSFTKPGRYFVWVRANGNNDGGASIHLGLGLKAEAWGLNMHTGNGRWAWTRSKPFQVPVPGTYLFSIWMREDGAMVDRFLFTVDEKYEPSPDERADDRVMVGPGP